MTIIPEQFSIYKTQYNVLGDWALCAARKVAEVVSLPLAISRFTRRYRVCVRENFCDSFHSIRRRIITVFRHIRKSHFFPEYILFLFTAHFIRYLIFFFFFYSSWVISGFGYRSQIPNSGFLLSWNTKSVRDHKFIGNCQLWRQLFEKKREIRKNACVSWPTVSTKRCKSVRDTVTVLINFLRVAISISYV